MSSSDATPVDPDLPAVDERLVAPETRYEIYDGELVHVSPADPPHGIQHSKISALVEAHAASDFQVASDMLTRTSRTSDVAPDVSVFPMAPDPETGGRQLEQLAFEVVSTVSLSHARRKAALLVARGVRRVFVIDVKRGRAQEWSRALAAWTVLDPGSYLEDRALAASLPVAALLNAAKADDVLARALIIKKNPVIKAERSRAMTEGKRAGLAEGKRAGLAEGKRAGLAEGKRKGLAEGKRAGLAEGRRKGLAQAVLEILAARGVALDRCDRERILAERELHRLGRWIARASTCRSTSELFAEP